MSIVRITKILFLLAVFAGSVMTACASKYSTVELTPLFAHNTCPDTTPTPGIRVANTSEEADHIWSLCRRQLALGGDADTEKRPTVNFNEERLIYVHMGARRTGGYRLYLAGKRGQVVNKTLVIPIGWQEPARGDIVTQMLTHPCLLLAAPRGIYKRLEVVDQAGQIRFSEDLSAATP